MYMYENIKMPIYIPTSWGRMNPPDLMWNYCHYHVLPCLR